MGYRYLFCTVFSFPLEVYSEVSGYILRSRIVKSRDSYGIFFFLRNFCSGKHQFTPPPRVDKHSLNYMSLPTLAKSCLLDNSQGNR